MTRTPAMAHPIHEELVVVVVDGTVVVVVAGMVVVVVVVVARTVVVVAGTVVVAGGNVVVVPAATAVVVVAGIVVVVVGIVVVAGGLVVVVKGGLVVVTPPKVVVVAGSWDGRLLPQPAKTDPTARKPAPTRRSWRSRVCSVMTMLEVPTPSPSHAPPDQGPILVQYDGSCHIWIVVSFGPSRAGFERAASASIEQSEMHTPATHRRRRFTMLVALRIHLYHARRVYIVRDRAAPIRRQ
jgi:hypothetical protein